MKRRINKWEEREFGRSVDEVEQLRLIFSRYFLQKSTVTTAELDRIGKQGESPSKLRRPAAVAMRSDGVGENALNY